ncbi:MAG: SAM-dependent methyltransferase [Pseudomonadota bacterium]|nr:SAM-dependent methyltransferase [Pseudomonadota bacterium]
MDLVSLRNTYRRYANYYDYLFGPVLHPGRKLAVTLANPQPDQRILEVGVGTGLSLPFYRTDSRVIGIDLSPEMLDKARQRVARHRLDHVEMLAEMNAEHLTFSDGLFDVVVAMYVASVVSNPGRMVDEMRRVCKPGGDIIIVNHFISEHILLQRIETLLRPLSGMLGFRPDMRLDSLPDYPDFYRVQIINTNFLGYWKVIHYRNEALPFEPPNGELQILERPL